MSLYNMLYGVQPGMFYFIPMLGDKHADVIDEILKRNREK